MDVVREVAQQAIYRRASQLRDLGLYDIAENEAMLAVRLTADKYDRDGPPAKKAKKTKWHVASDAADNAARRVLHAETKLPERPAGVQLEGVKRALDAAWGEVWSSTDYSDPDLSDEIERANDRGAAHDLMRSDPILSELLTRAAMGYFSREDKAIVLYWSAPLAHVAQQTGLTTAAVSKRRQRILARLQKELGASAEPAKNIPEMPAEPATDEEVTRLPRTFDPD